MKVACVVCQGPIEVSPAHYYKYGKGRYCGETCQHAAYRERARQEVLERFWSRVDKTGSCWIRAGGLVGGYVGFSDQGEFISSHRFSAKLAGLDIDTGDVLHTCDRKRCVRNDEVGTYTVAGETFARRGHLFVASHSANMRDMIQKGRRSAVHTRKTSPEQRLLIAARLASGERAAILAEEYGVTAHRIYGIAKQVAR